MELTSTLQGTPLSRATTWRRTFNFRYRLAAQDPTFKATLWSYDPSIDDARDRWMVDVDGALLPRHPGASYATDGRRLAHKGKPLAAYREVCEVRADLASLIGASEVHDAEGKAWVQLQVDVRCQLCSPRIAHRTDPDLRSSSSSLARTRSKSQSSGRRRCACSRPRAWSHRLTSTPCAGQNGARTCEQAAAERVL